MEETVVVRVGELGQTVLLSPKQFKTGSRGYFGQGKVVINGIRYQATMQLVEIGSGRRAS